MSGNHELGNEQQLTMLHRAGLFAGGAAIALIGAGCASDNGEAAPSVSPEPIATEVNTPAAESETEETEAEPVEPTEQVNEAAESLLNPLGISKEVFDNAIVVGPNSDPNAVYPAGTVFDLHTEAGLDFKLFVGNTIIADDLLVEEYGPDAAPHMEPGWSYALVEVGVKYRDLGNLKDVMASGYLFGNVTRDVNFWFIDPSSGENASRVMPLDYPHSLTRFDDIFSSDIEGDIPSDQVFSGYLLREVRTDDLEDGTWAMSHNETDAQFPELLVESNFADASSSE